MNDFDAITVLKFLKKEALEKAQRYEDSFPGQVSSRRQDVEVYDYCIKVLEGRGQKF